MPMESYLAHLASRLAHVLDERDPAGSLARLGVTLRVCDRPLRSPNKSVLGAWDPLLRRIELFGCDDTRSDDQIVETLGHELWHAVGHDDPSADAEATARRFARAWLRELGRGRVRQCAAALRSQMKGRRESVTIVADQISGLRPTDNRANPPMVNIGL